jgi:hypothetical protein
MIEKTNTDDVDHDETNGKALMRPLSTVEIEAPKRPNFSEKRNNPSPLVQFWGLIVKRAIYTFRRYILYTLMVSKDLADKFGNF